MIMKQSLSLVVLLGMLTVGICSCKKEQKETKDIITKIAPKPKAPSGPQQMSNHNYKKSIEWLGNNYTVTISRYADKSLAMATDGEKQYYDNKVDVKIIREDGSVFFKKTFTKSDFKEYTDNQYGRNGALIGFMYDTVEGNYVKFGASVGSPDPNSDEFIPIDVSISNLGAVNISSSIQVDTNTDEQKPKKTELEMAEEDGM